MRKNFLSHPKKKTANKSRKMHISFRQRTLTQYKNYKWTLEKEKFLWYAKFYFKINELEMRPKNNEELSRTHAMQTAQPILNFISRKFLLWRVYSLIIRAFYIFCCFAVFRFATNFLRAKTRRIFIRVKTKPKGGTKNGWSCMLHGSSKTWVR